ncbi:MAG: hypothetical protein ANABAC_3662 [Anaerolineae bacterium]|jgi:hypothetical protein|nr:MAG: hypothetical protein ANABAC_3662 [Anaerolineae bacterium]
MIRINGALYPYQEVPEALESPDGCNDFIACLCATRNFGLLSAVEVVKELCKSKW